MDDDEHESLFWFNVPCLVAASVVPQWVATACWVALLVYVVYRLAGSAIDAMNREDA